MKILALDVETTGLWENVHDIIQLASIVLEDGKETEHTFNQHCQPTSYKEISQEALNVTGMTVHKLRAFQKSEKMLDNFIAYLGKSPGKYVMLGHNVGFDKKFVFAWFKKHGKTEQYHQFFELYIHDTYSRAKIVKKQKKFGLKQKLNLGALCELFGITLDNAHDALADIRATVEVDRHLSSLLGESITAQPKMDHTIAPEGLVEPAHLHLHSYYNLAESTQSYDEWISWAEDNSIPGISIVDHGPATSLFAATNNSSDITTIPGVFTTIIKDSLALGVNMWATDNNSYSTLMQIATNGYDKTISNRDTKEKTIVQSSFLDKMDTKGMFFGTGDVYSEIGIAIKNNDLILAKTIFEKYVECFGDDLAVELIPIDITYSYSKTYGLSSVSSNDTVSDGNLGKAYNRFMYKMSQEHNCKVIVSDAAHFIKTEDKNAADVLSLATYKETGFCAVESYHVKLAKESYSILKSHIPELDVDLFNTWANNSIDLIKNVDINIESSHVMPIIPIPEHIKQHTNDYDQQLLIYTLERCKFHGRMIDTQEYKDRLKMELDVIAKNKALNFLPYFLMFEDIGCYAREMKILQNIGRGSAGGSLLSYYLKIIHIDPVKENLPFERFLSHARIAANSLPDIDCDFGTRDPILDYLKEKYGFGFAQIGTLLTIKTKGAIKLAMSSLHGKGQNDPAVKDICNYIPDSPQGVAEIDFINGFTDREGEYHPGLMETSEYVKSYFEMHTEVYKLVCKLVGLPRTWGRHPSGFIVSNINLYKERIPLWKSPDNTDHIYVSQYEAHMVEQMGLVKADILGVKTILTVSQAMDSIKERHGIDLWEEKGGVAAIYRLPYNKGVYDDFYNARTDSTFQFNTSMVKKYVKQFAPQSISDLSIMTSLLRPGSLDAEIYGVSATQYYLDVKNGISTVQYIHSDMEKYVGETNGIFCFQEQILFFLVDFAGYSLEESDVIRSAIAKKKKDVMLAAFDRIRSAADKRGWTKEQADIICQQVMAFSNYSFNKSHGMCVFSDQLIRTDRGLTKMIDIVDNKDMYKVQSYNVEGDKIEYHTPTDAWQSGTEMVYDIELEDGTVMKLTDNHKVLTMDNEWKTVIEVFESGSEIKQIAD